MLAAAIGLRLSNVQDLAVGLRQGLAVAKAVNLLQGIRGRMLVQVRLRQAATLAVQARCGLGQAALAANPVKASCGLVQAAYEQLPVYAVAASIIMDGREIEFIDLSMETDEDSYCISCTVRLARVEDWANVGIGEALTVLLDAAQYLFMVDSKSRETSSVRPDLLLTARSPASRLDTPYAEALAMSWENTNAKAIAEQLVAGVVLDWRITDWPVKSFSASGMSPLQALTTLVTEACALVSTPGGALIVQYKYPVSPFRIEEAAVALQLSDRDHIELLRQDFDFQPGYDAVDVLDGTSQATETIQLTEWAGPDGDDAPILPPGQRMLAFTSWPYREVNLRTSSCDAAVTFVSSELVTTEEVISIENGVGTLSYPAESILSSEYRCANLGQVTVVGGNVFTQELGQSLLRIKYNFRVQLFLLEGPALEQVQVWGEVEEVTVNGPLLVRVVRNQGRNPAPDVVVDTQCQALAIAVERGRNYLAEVGSSKYLYSIRTRPMAPPLPGSVVEVAEEALGQVFRAKLTGWSFEQQDDGVAHISWDVERSIL